MESAATIHSGVHVAARSIPAAKVLGALSFALDLTDGQPMGHSMQSCLIGMRIGACLGLHRVLQSELYYALLLKDAGCSSNSSKLYHLLQSDEIRAKHSLRERDWTRHGLEQLRYALKNIAVGKPLLRRVGQIVKVARQPPQTGNLYSIRCERGASIARQIGFSSLVTEAILNLDEHWDGQGYPQHLTGERIPLLARIMNLSQTLAVFWSIGGARAAVDVAKRRSGRWFDPELVRAALSVARHGHLFHGLADTDIVATVARLEPKGLQLRLNDDGIDRICDAFAAVIDTKSPFTFRHSTGVSKAAVAIGRKMGYNERTIIQLRRAGLLHDIGKLAIPNSILEKPGRLTPAEWEAVRKHPDYTLQILRRIPGFEELSHIAASHHERLDGKGYFRNLTASELSMPARILAVADVYDALAAVRPYRAALPREQVFTLMENEVPHSLDIDCLRALQACPEADLALSDTRTAHPAVSLRKEQVLPALAPLFA